MTTDFTSRKDLEQTLYTREKALEKAFGYLDKFKAELAGVKEELVQEKTSLNNALKQIQHMTGERNRLKQQLKGARLELTRNMEGFGTLLSVLIRKRVETNQGHHERVAHIAGFVAEQMKTDEKPLEDLRKAAMLHEVGLLFMPQAALAKSPGQMTEFEKDVLAQYPVKGAELLCQCRAFERAARIIRHMNENSDGTGTPDGLKKRHIPLMSRILAGADVLDTLRDDPENTNLEALLASLEKVSGSRLDPLVVSCLQKYAVLHMGTDAHRIRGVGVEQLEPGMQLGCALFTATGTKLFSADTVLSKEAIEKIIKYNREYPVDETVYVKA